MTIVFYSFLHFLVDSICAAAMFSRFLNGTDRSWWILVYNFCAFVLQMPFGVLLDSWNEGAGSSASRQNSFTFALAGSILTIVGAFTSPVILGIGNALFHVGGGVGTILEDRACGSAGRRLGVFVAPGAMGLFLGTLAARSSFGESTLSTGTLWLIGSAAITFALLAALWRFLLRMKRSEDLYVTAARVAVSSTSQSGVRCISRVDSSDSAYAVPIRSRFYEMLIISCCFFVVMIRSYVGMAVTMPWKTTAAAGLTATGAIVFGKMAGGFSAAAFGRKRIVLWTLLIAAICYVFCGHMAVGLLALFLFNMTMPITLQILVEQYKSLPGTMFGLLTVGLFLGFLPVYYSVAAPASGNAVGAALCIVSLIFLSVAAASSEPRSDNLPAAETQ